MEEALQEIKESLKTLPSHIREVVTQTNWEPKIEELALKYSLTNEQKRALFIEVLLVLVAINPEEEIVENIENELGVSTILAEQLAEEVGERVFSWIYKLYTEKAEQHTHNGAPKQPINTLDTPPPNLPGEIIEDLPLPPVDQEPLFAKTQQRPLRDTVADFFAKPEPIETPVIEPTSLPKPESANTTSTFISKKLSQPSTISTPSRTPQSYTVDPYREPVE